MVGLNWIPVVANRTPVKIFWFLKDQITIIHFGLLDTGLLLRHGRIIIGFPLIFKMDVFIVKYFLLTLLIFVGKNS